MQVITELMEKNKEALLEQSNVKEQMRGDVTKPLF
jgi:hypothetical protein